MRQWKRVVGLVCGSEITGRKIQMEMGKRIKMMTSSRLDG